LRIGFDYLGDLLVAVARFSELLNFIADHSNKRFNRKRLGS
jgi:hypothetical protein